MRVFFCSENIITQIKEEELTGSFATSVVRAKNGSVKLMTVFFVGTKKNAFDSRASRHSKTGNAGSKNFVLIRSNRSFESIQ